MGPDESAQKQPGDDDPLHLDDSLVKASTKPPLSIGTVFMTLATPLTLFKPSKNPPEDPPCPSSPLQPPSL
jgi:hypothetical protein